ncbi:MULTISPECIES: hypothetical protein [unclassified Mesorhizobium]|uniref:hypothetical protein n=1 Tax=unclassified Mesorhizobium TaxID=325217 RepID=UPI001127B604|nr:MULTISPECIES: hypothetical protein [unclassified Mesorhizobium]MBZ9960835.1 hypothetical protein [Mesorhizobium sp. BR1-1-14]TPJ49734.1 hypothetical protein FJ426_25580 [Mesorhizobium sp. B2-6-4]TPM92460.1 hypothetical protein FJ966_22255 [Mesorhizobium sp. B2-1-5]
MPRYATIITGDDGLEVVSAIGEFEGAAPQTRLGRIEQVATGVLIGMVRDAAGGFAFPQATIHSGAIGLAMAGLKDLPGVAKPARRPKGARNVRKKSTRSKKKRVRSVKSVPSKAKAGDAEAVTGHG